MNEDFLKVVFQMRTLVGLLLVLFMSTGSASAQQVDNVYKDWTVFTLNQKGKKVCYIASSPTSKTGNYRRRGEPYLLVTHRDATTDEVSTSSGYPYKINSEVKVTVDGKHKFGFFTSNDIPKVAWTRNSTDDKALVEKMIKGVKLKVRGESRLNTYSLDSYSLLGFTSAYKRMKALCK